MLNAGIIDQDIGAAKIAGDVAHHAFNRVRIGQIRPGKPGFDAIGVRNFLLQCFGFILCCEAA